MKNGQSVPQRASSIFTLLTNMLVKFGICWLLLSLSIKEGLEIADNFMCIVSEAHVWKGIHDIYVENANR
jgi:hypothetical protein